MPQSRRASIVAMMLAASSTTLAASLPESYLELLHDYRTNEVEDAIEEMASLSKKRARELRDELSSTELGLSNEDVRAAVLLHTQAAIVLDWRNETDDRDAHFELAALLSDTLERGDFQRVWLESMGYYYQSNLEERKAVSLFERLTRDYPGSAAGWLGWGTVLESVASVGGPSSANLGFVASPWHGEATEVTSARRDLLQRSLRRAKLSRARAHYAEALEREPDSAEIRLRLGRTSELLGDADTAREHYAWIAQSARAEGFHKAMARLFFGRMLERGGAVEASIAQYREAMLADPSLQTTYLALSHALQLSGKREASAAIMTRALRLGELESDPKTGRSRYLFRLDAFIDGILSLQSELVP